MKLFKFPYLLQKEVFDNMEYQDLFLLSFISNKMKKTIKSCQANRFKSISFIRYCGMNKRTFVDIVAKNHLKEDFVEIKERDNTKMDYFQLKLFGKIIDFRKSRRDHIFEAAFNPDESESVIKSIHNYMLQFFGDSLEYIWSTSDWVNTVPQLQNLSPSISMWHVNPDLIDLENFFSTNPPFKMIEFQPTRPINFNPGSKFYQAETVVTLQHNNYFPSVLRHFQGKQAFVHCTYHNTEDFIEFVNKWKSGEAFRKLEVLNFKALGDDDIDHETVLNGIGAKHIDARKTPPTHTLPKICDWHQFSPSPNPITSHIYVVRESDNRVASVSVQRRKFHFGVWDKTEEEFLRSME
ncbi:hypothetical protein B9Z55_025449 [Caenorhabditis nigoni]|uniref:F-box domain-containing protein n=1 Tax=Caenorhabditis nigoni TaxID=1611254 RepID=A0A2G5SYV4_9PELO|nr:hypothetical protein B9Z55_025449 [Caenorhabditis nigoni]